MESLLGFSQHPGQLILTRMKEWLSISFIQDCMNKKKVEEGKKEAINIDSGKRQNHEMMVILSHHIITTRNAN